MRFVEDWRIKIHKYRGARWCLCKHDFNVTLAQLCPGWYLLQLKIHPSYAELCGILFAIEESHISKWGLSTRFKGKLLREEAKSAAHLVWMLAYVFEGYGDSFLIFYLTKVTSISVQMAGRDRARTQVTASCP